MMGDRLVAMANQIGRFFIAQDRTEIAAAGIALHLKKFWEPRMRAEIIALAESGAAELEPAAAAAVGILKKEGERLHGSVSPKNVESEDHHF